MVQTYTKKIPTECRIKNGTPYFPVKDGTVIRLAGNPNFFAKTFESLYGNKEGLKHYMAFLKVCQELSETQIRINGKLMPVAPFMVYHYED